MTPNENKPREFWIWRDKEDRYADVVCNSLQQAEKIWGEGFEVPLGDIIHIIEYSAYEKLQKEFLELQKELDLLQEFKTMYCMGYDLKSLDQMRTENSKLKSELERVTKERDKYIKQNAPIFATAEEYFKSTGMESELEELKSQLQTDNRWREKYYDKVTELNAAESKLETAVKALEDIAFRISSSGVDKDGNGPCRIALVNDRNERIIKAQQALEQLKQGLK